MFSLDATRWHIMCYSRHVDSQTAHPLPSTFSDPGSSSEKPRLDILLGAMRFLPATKISHNFSQSRFHRGLLSSYLSMRHVKYSFDSSRQASLLLPLLALMHCRYRFMIGWHSPSWSKGKLPRCGGVGFENAALPPGDPNVDMPL